MKFYLGKAEAEQLEFGGEEGLFKVDNKFFNFEIEVEDDMVRISDSVGRIMPIDMDDVKDMAEALGRIARYNEGKKRAKEFLQWELAHVDLGDEDRPSCYKG